MSVSFSEMRRPNYTKFPQEHTSLVLKSVLHIRYYASFRNWNPSKATGIKNRGQIWDFLTPCKNRGGWAKCLSELYEFGLGPNLWYTFDGVSLDRVED